MAKLVNWEKFERAIREKDIPLFSVHDVAQLLDVSKSSATFLVHRYNKKGWVVRYKRGLYAVQDELPSDLLVANKLYEPSYISLEFALAYHGVIPETVYEMTSVTTKATRKYNMGGITFSYRRIKQPAFGGYQLEKQNGIGYKIADAEKAFVDLHYFRLREGNASLERFDKSKLNAKKAVKYAKSFDNEKLVALVSKLLK